jgi:tetratricopeptide (TPR) repeat protein
MFQTLRRKAAIVTLGGGLLAVGCARSPEAEMARHLARGDAYAAAAQYQEAIIEYRNVLRIDQANARALRQLGLAHYRLGELAQSYPYLRKARDLRPDDVEVRLDLGTIELGAGKSEDALQDVGAVLERDPMNLRGITLLAALASAPGEVNEAIARLEAARAAHGGRVEIELALGPLFLRKQDIPGAGRAFARAVELDPKSVEAHSALGNFFVGTGNMAQAEREFTAASDLAPIDSPVRMKLADFYVHQGRLAEARRILTDVMRQAPQYLPAWRRLAELALDERKYDESLKLARTVLDKNPSDVDAHVVMGRLRLAKRESAEAALEFREALRLDPHHARARFDLGQALLQAGNVQQAKVEFREAVASAPDLTEAVLALARINLQTGAVSSAIEDLERLVARDPRQLEAHALLGSAYLANREPARATEEFRRLKAMSPKDARGPYLVGVGLRAQGRSTEARAEFETALAMAPGYVEPLAQLVGMALADKRADAALAVATKQMGLAPRSGGVQRLVGIVQLARHDDAAAEAAFLKAIELEPTLLSAYMELGAMYRKSGRYGDALARVSDGLKASPGNVSLLMLLGVTSDAMGDVPRARKAYEDVLAVNPRFAPAANNLAWLLSEQGDDKGRALGLAETAREEAPDEPRVADTIGWILYKRGVYQRAVGLLRESAAKLPDDPLIQYHLGLAAAKVGDRDGARAALTAASSSLRSPRERDEARKMLATLK